jgi:peptidoglycan/LPS O-acetylase OafA/YrhL
MTTIRTAPGDSAAIGGRLPGLDGLRGLAAIFVLVGHHNASPAWTLYPVLSAIQYTLSASFAVVVFFTLSSFLLTYLMVREHDRNGYISYVGFFRRRILRIWPLYFVVVAIGVALARGMVPEARYSWIIHNLWRPLTLTSNWSLAFDQIGGYHDQFLAPGAVLWSIAVEEQFYLIFPFIVAYLLRSSRRRRMGVVIGVVALAFAYRAWMFFHVIPLQTMLPRGAIYYATLSYFDVFLAGGIAGWLAARRPGISHVVPGAAVLIGIAVAVAIWRETLVDGATIAYFFAQPAVGIPVAAAMLWIIGRPEHMMTRVLNSRTLVAIGTLSYGMYLWHPIAHDIYWWRFLVRLDNRLPTDVFGPISLVMFVISAIALAAAGYWLIERPFLNLGRRYATQVKPANEPTLGGLTMSSFRSPSSEEPDCSKTTS